MRGSTASPRSRSQNQLVEYWVRVLMKQPSMVVPGLDGGRSPGTSCNWFCPETG